jgi:hypothetical protein
MSDNFFRELLGVKPGAGKTDIKRAFHRLVRKNHPDCYPEEQKAIQEMKMIALNEAYSYLIEAAGVSRAGTSESGTAKVKTTGEEAVPADAVGQHKDPAYAYYKQGFVHYSRALHGIEALHHVITFQKVSFKPQMAVYEHFVKSLTFLSKAHGYFTRVAEEFPQSVWCRDANIKIRRIERFNVLYRRIISNYEL